MTLSDIFDRAADVTEQPGNNWDFADALAIATNDKNEDYPCARAVLLTRLKWKTPWSRNMNRRNRIKVLRDLASAERVKEGGQ